MCRADLSGKPETVLYLPSKEQKVFSGQKANVAGQHEERRSTTTFPTAFLPDGFDVLLTVLEELLSQAGDEEELVAAERSFSKSVRG